MAKVIDFGIAKALAQPLTDRTLHHRGRAGDRHAGVHESGAGRSVGARRRHAHGRLLARRDAVRAARGAAAARSQRDRPLGVHGAARTPRNESEHRPVPSCARWAWPARVITDYRRTDVKALRRELRGDLDWIVMKALEPDRVRRYDTVNGLAMDIERYLRSEPVIARPPSTTYRLSRFARRNRIAVLAGSAVVLSLVAGLTDLGHVAGARATRRGARRARGGNGAPGVGVPHRPLPGVRPGRGARQQRSPRARSSTAVPSASANDLASQPLVQAQLMYTIGSVYRELGLFTTPRRCSSRRWQSGSAQLVGG